MSANASQDATHIAAILAGDRHVLREVMRLHGGAMQAAARTIAPHAADDIVQDAWISALEALYTFEQRASLKTWLVRITMNKAYSHLRKTRHEVSLDGLADHEDPLQQAFDAGAHWQTPWQSWPEQSPDALLEAHALQGCLDKHIQSLPEGQRAVLVQTDLLGLAVTEICNNLEISASNCRVLLHRARVRLHAMVAHYQETGEC
jgi:RNA polymerase sigma-70 factor (ECF subfamily)